MFSKETFTSYIQNFTGENADKDLMAFAEKFPFNSNAQILLTKVFYEQKNIGFNEQLKLASLYAIDRKFLFKYIHTPFAQRINDVVIDTAIVEATAEQQTVKIESEKESISLEHANHNSLVQLVDTIHEAVITESLEIKETEAPNLIVLNEKIESSSWPIIKEVTEEQVIEESIPKVDEIVETSIEASEPQISVNVESKPNVMANIRPVDINQPQTFLSWLQQGQYALSKAPSAELPDNVVTKAPAKEESINEEESNEPEWPLGQPQHIDKKAKNKKIVDKFILDQPRIKPVKADFYNPSEKAKKSVEEDEDLVSETLVLIYAKQGNYRKAIKALEKLSLKFPEKSAYFASQIEKIKDYLVKNNVK